ncbi:hypothetical protein [Bartonella sp. AP281QHHD]|uniref:hypothetical protein n=1 Tax=Bartonella sp. AP281QHHD TaxID=3243481 RepID=UPI0035CEAB35
MLIQSFLFFILGVAFTSWLLVLLSPFIWRKAVHFAYKDVCAKMPLSLAEIEANHDFLRAQHAVELANNQQKYEFLQKKICPTKNTTEPSNRTILSAMPPHKRYSHQRSDSNQTKYRHTIHFQRKDK